MSSYKFMKRVIISTSNKQLSECIFHTIKNIRVFNNINIKSRYIYIDVINDLNNFYFIVYYFWNNSNDIYAFTKFIDNINENVDKFNPGVVSGDISIKSSDDIIIDIFDKDFLFNKVLDILTTKNVYNYNLLSMNTLETIVLPIERCSPDMQKIKFYNIFHYILKNANITNNSEIVCKYIDFMTSANEIQLLWHNSPIYMLTMSGDSITDDLVKNCINQYIQYYKNVTEQVFDFVPFAIIECDGIKNPDFIKFPGYIHKTVIILFKDKKNNDVLRFEQYKQPADKKALL
ncbi:MAG: hypothetical protein KDH96_08235, partial [Candidatus Riesia sp.]|nr:hypothetical protein [Candidatus Riesia sp.]